MSTFPLNLSKFKKVSSDGHVSVLRHKDGHEIKIAHSKLSDSLRSKLEKLPTMHQMAKGGDVDDADQKLPTPMPAPTPSGPAEYARMTAPIRTAPSLTSEEEKSLFSRELREQKTTEPVTPQTVAMADQTLAEEKPAKAIELETQPTVQPAQALSPQMQALEKQKAGELGAIQAQLAGAKEQEDILSKAAGPTQLEEAQKAFLNQQAKLQEISDKRKALQDDIAAFHVDPHRVIKNMSTGDKILTALGLIIGGMGAGLTHGPNLAYSFLEKKIDDDINTQKNELGKKQSLLSENLKETNDLNEAMKLTRIQMNDIINHQLLASQAKTQNLQARAMMQQVAGKFDASSAQLQNQMAMQHAATSGQGATPAQLVPFLVPEKHQESVFKEIEAAENTKKMASNIMDAFEQAAKENTVLRTGAGLLRTPASVYALHQHMQPTFKDLEGTVRQAAMDNTFKNVTPMPGDIQHTIDQKRQALQEYLQSKSSAPRAKAFGIDLSQFPTTQPMSTDIHEGRTGTLPDGTRVRLVQGKLQVIK